ncbi:unnamed protein product [Urochloa humidicola]
MPPRQHQRGIIFTSKSYLGVEKGNAEPRHLGVGSFHAEISLSPGTSSSSHQFPVRLSRRRSPPPSSLPFPSTSRFPPPWKLWPASHRCALDEIRGTALPPAASPAVVKRWCPSSLPPGHGHSATTASVPPPAAADAALLPLSLAPDAADALFNPKSEISDSGDELSSWRSPSTCPCSGAALPNNGPASYATTTAPEHAPLRHARSGCPQDRH